MHKVADGLLSGRYSHSAPYACRTPLHPSDPLWHPSLTLVFQQGIKPTSFKALIGKRHPEFSTMKQQDSEEFLSCHCPVQGYAQIPKLTCSRRDCHPSVLPLKCSCIPHLDPTVIFSYGMEEHLQCGDCKKVRYRVDNMDVVSLIVRKEWGWKDNLRGRPPHTVLRILTGDLRPWSMPAHHVRLSSLFLRIHSSGLTRTIGRPSLHPSWCPHRTY